jgi:NADH-quinone oxidoreductase subunit G
LPPQPPVRPEDWQRKAGGLEVSVKVTVCVGSSCHVRGSRDVLKRFAEIIRTENLGDRVALLGSFCMEHCGEGMNWKFNDDDISSQSVEEAEQTLRSRLQQTIQET